MPVPSPALYRYAANRDYEKIPPRVETHPVDVYWTDRYGSTALHLLCQDRSMEDPASLLHAVDSILWVAPEVVAWANAATWSPMHFAAEKRLVASAALMMHLIKACPHAVSLRTKRGYKTKTPFHIACEAGASYRVLKAMLAIDPRLAVQPFVPQEDQHCYAAYENPLQLLWRYEPRTVETFTKMALLLQAAYCGTVTNSDSDCEDNNHNNTHAKQHRSSSFSVINAVCTVRCPTDYAAIILDKCPADQPDAHGLLPLHCAVRQQSRRTPPHYTQFIIQHLVRKAPATAAVPDRLGRLPLHVAVGDVGLTWHKGGVRELSFTYTAALRQPDPRTGLVPALQSAVRATESRLHLSTTLELLLMAPEVVLPCNGGTATKSFPV